MTGDARSTKQTTAARIAASERRIVKWLAISFVAFLLGPLALYWWDASLPRWSARSIPPNGLASMEDQGAEGMFALGTTPQMRLVPKFFAPVNIAERVFIFVSEGKAEAVASRELLHDSIKASSNGAGYIIIPAHVETASTKLAPMALQLEASIEFRRISQQELKAAILVPSAQGILPEEREQVFAALDDFWKSNVSLAPPLHVQAWMKAQTVDASKKFATRVWLWGVALNLIWLLLLIAVLGGFLGLLITMVKFWLIGRGWKNLGGMHCAKCKYVLEWLRPDADGFIRCPECGEAAFNTRSTAS
jgi:hypothetical protein